MLEMIYKTDVYIGVLLSDPPFVQKSTIRGSKMLNWPPAKRELATSTATGVKVKFVELVPMNPCLVSKVAQFNAEFSSSITHF